MFERFTDTARRVLVDAQGEARGLDHPYVGTEHLILGVVDQPCAVGARAIERLGLPLDAVRAAVLERVGPGAAPGPLSPPFTRAARRALELSLGEARTLGAESIGPEHLLLGIMREGNGVGAQVMMGLGADLGALRRRVVELDAGFSAA